MSARPDLGEGSYFKTIGTPEEAMIERTEAYSERSDIVDVAQRALAFQEKHTSKKESLSFKNLVHLKDSFDKRFAHTNRIVRFFDQIIHGTRDEKIAQGLREQIEKLDPESIIARPYFVLKGEQIDRTFKREDRSDIVQVATKALAPKTSLSFSALLQLKSSFEHRYEDKNWLFKTILNLLHKSRDSDISSDEL